MNSISDIFPTYYDESDYRINNLNEDLVKPLVNYDSILNRKDPEKPKADPKYLHKYITKLEGMDNNTNNDSIKHILSEIIKNNQKNYDVFSILTFILLLIIVVLLSFSVGMSVRSSSMDRYGS